MKVSIVKKAQKDIDKIDFKQAIEILLAIKDLEKYPNVSNTITIGRVLHRSKAYE